MGSIDWRLVAHCPVPILMVKSPATAPYSHIVAAVDPVHTHAKPADLDEVIIDCAMVMQVRTKAKLSLLHCYLPLARFRPDEGSSVPLKDAEKALEVSRQASLNTLASEAGLSPSATRLREGKPQAVLELMIANGEADLIVMGGLSRGRIADLLIGSTAEHMLQHGECDLLIVKPRA
jgi:universal stress protein E